MNYRPILNGKTPPSLPNRASVNEALYYLSCRSMEAEELKHQLFNARMAEKEAKEKLIHISRRTLVPVTVS